MMKLLGFDFLEGLDDGGDFIGGDLDVPCDEIGEVLTILDGECNMGFEDPMAEQRRMHGRGKDMKILLAAMMSRREEKKEEMISNSTRIRGDLENVKREIKGVKRRVCATDKLVPLKKSCVVSHRQNLLSKLKKNKSKKSTVGTYHLYRRPIA